MKLASRRQFPPNPAFEIVKLIGLALPGVTSAVKYDGSPLLKVDGRFMAGLATHPSAEPDTLVLRAVLADRQNFLHEDPATYYLTHHYRRYPVLLIRLQHVEPATLRELLSISWRITKTKIRKPKLR